MRLVGLRTDIPQHLPTPDPVLVGNEFHWEPRQCIDEASSEPTIRNNDWNRLVHRKRGKLSPARNDYQKDRELPGDVDE